MNPDQFERLVADNFTAQGFKCDVQGGSGDHGVDIIAINKKESIAIQVKMYNDRDVNENSWKRYLTHLIRSAY